MNGTVTVVWCDVDSMQCEGYTTHVTASASLNFRFLLCVTKRMNGNVSVSVVT